MCEGQVMKVLGFKLKNWDLLREGKETGMKGRGVLEGGCTVVHSLQWSSSWV